MKGFALLKQKTLVVYVFHEYNDNVDFFIKNGLFNNDNIDFIIVINNPYLKIAIPSHINNVKLYNRENIGHDFGGWSYILFMERDNKFIYEIYNYYVLINSSVRGPFLPVWQKDNNWVGLLTDLITDEVKLAGTTIGIYNGNPHVQSMVLVTDKVGIDIGINKGIFNKNPFNMDKKVLIELKEIGYSREILEAGYNIKCLLKSFDGIDFRITHKSNYKYDDILCFKKRFNVDIHPYEVIFIKSMPGTMLNKYTKWMSKSDLVLKEGKKYDTKIPTNFNVDRYLQLHPELKKDVLLLGRNAKDVAINHWYLNERDTYDQSTKYFLVNLNPVNGSGLFNQMITLVNSIIVGNYTGRDIVIWGFCANYNDNHNTIPLHKVFDISHINSMLISYNLPVKIMDYEDFDHNIRWKRCAAVDLIFDKTSPTTKNNFFGMIEILKDNKDKYLHPNRMFSLFDVIYNKNIYLTDRNNKLIKSMIIPSQDQQLNINDNHQLCDYMIKLSNNILFDLKFHPSFYEIINFCKSIYSLDNYGSIHFRLEDDMIKSIVGDDQTKIKNYSEVIFSRYLIEIKKIFKPNDVIYISTHLCKSNNYNNNKLYELKKLYPKIVFIETNLWRKEFPYIDEGREIDAIIDYLICRDSHSFICFEGSTFSNTLRDFFIKNNKTVLTISNKSN